jgi:hypothetical protein
MIPTFDSLVMRQIQSHQLWKAIGSVQPARPVRSSAPQLGPEFARSFAVFSVDPI